MDMDKKPYEIKTDVQFVVIAYKIAQGVPEDDRLWDKGNFGKAVRAATILIAELGGREEAIKVIHGIKIWAEDRGLDWKISTVLKRASDWKAGRLIVSRGAKRQDRPKVPALPGAKAVMNRLEAAGMAMAGFDLIEEFSV